MCVILPYPALGTQVFNLGVLSVESMPAQLIIIAYAFLNLVMVSSAILGLHSPHGTHVRSG